VTRSRIDERLSEAYDAGPDERRAVVRAVVDLRDSGRYRETTGRELTPELVVSELEDAPDEYGLAERWNWWIGALDLAYGDFDRFAVNRWTGRRD